jgi:hypothetical protein
MCPRRQVRSGVRWQRLFTRDAADAKAWVIQKVHSESQDLSLGLFGLAASYLDTAVGPPSAASGSLLAPGSRAMHTLHIISFGERSKRVIL